MEEGRTRLKVDDKRDLFQSLLAMSERLLMLNKFPVDMEDFALSLQDREVEHAWRLLRGVRKNALAPSNDSYFKGVTGQTFLLHRYPNETGDLRLFMPVNSKNALSIDKARRHQNAVKIWCERQLRLEEQLLRTAGVLNDIVHHCNTVGQYKRVSPDLLTFLPEKYRLGLKDYEKQSPYPDLQHSPEEVETAMATLAYAALQPAHHAEKEYERRSSWNRPRYNLGAFPRTRAYAGYSARSLGI